ncbi:MAG TPA: autotransporter outer membrane beta-barrel domain-containing protein, partial [Paraburkholderia sp.]
GRLAYWTGGFVNFGSSDTAAIQLSHTLVGVSGGVDYRFSPDFTGGIGAGYGRDVSDIGENDTQSTGQATSAAFYGSYHPGHIFMDGLLGLSRLDFDSDRFVTTTGATATGSRGGSQFFGSLSSGYEFRQNGWLVSPYGRFQASWNRLDDFTESGAGAYNLSYGSQSLSMLSTVAGLRGEYAIPTSWGTLSTRGRVEYTHDFAGSSRAVLGYADTGTLPYGIDVLGLSQNSMSVEFGVEAQFKHGVSLSFAYEGSFGFEDSAQDHTFLIKFKSKF